MEERSKVKLGKMEVEIGHVKEAVLDLTKSTKELVVQVQASAILTSSFQDTAERLGSKIDNQEDELKEVKREVTDLKIARAKTDAEAGSQRGLVKTIGTIALTALITGFGVLAFYLLKQ